MRDHSAHVSHMYGNMGTILRRWRSHTCAIPYITGNVGHCTSRGEAILLFGLSVTLDSLPSLW
jgi:hypothetical protein